MKDSIRILLVVFLPFLFALLPAVWPAQRKKSLAWFCLLVPLAVFILIMPWLNRVEGGQQLWIDINWIPTIGVNFEFLVDGLSVLFSLIISGIGVLVFLYSIYYLHDHENFHRYYAALLAFMGSMLGVVYTRNLVVLFVFWELTSLSSFMLIGYWFHRKESRYGALKALFITGTGGLFMLAGFVLLALACRPSSGSISFDLREIFAYAAANPTAIAESPYFTAMLLCILVGAFTKSGQFPFYNWLPDAMAAPTPISAYLHSSTMVKAGIFLMARLFPLFGGTDLWFHVVGGGGTITMVLCAYMALKHYDLKRILAYSTLSTLGLITACYGYGTKIGIHLNNFHIMNHAFYKACLFMIAGIIDHATGTRDIRELGQLRKHMRYTWLIACVAALSMCGIPLPPVMGFLSKEFLFEQVMHLYHEDHSLWFYPLAAFLTACFTVGYSLKLIVPVFWGTANKGTEHCHGEAPFGMLLGPGLLAVGIILGGCWVALPDSFVLKLFLASDFVPQQQEVTTILHTNVAIWHNFSAFALTASVIVVGLLIYKFIRRFDGILDKGGNPTEWPDRFYNFSFDGTIKGATFVSNIAQDGNLRHYVFLTFFAIVALLSGAYLWNDGTITFVKDTTVPNFWAICLAVITVASILLVIFYPHRLAKIFFLGVVGYAVCLFFFFYRAPDLALTQLLIESVSLLLFLLVFYRLPHFDYEDEPKLRRIVDGMLSLAVGCVMFFFTYNAISQPLFDNITPYFIENTIPKAHGKNVVNTILVDFRGFDTMGEITVLCIAAMGVYALLKIHRKVKKK